ncbi:probable CCR4-associated factor 1 homolog 10 [Populus nigra]|uniref:probable CCR4-associated factor 1 homolog 10 n=1 Tax=Populus nigra TaxID=3691 RepID=UPI002B265566|nr:probable CCR4-associated factor 1 homolog 10 [Populus nigra]
MKSSKPAHLREVWADNLVYEFFLIKEAISGFPLVALDTEFPEFHYAWQFNFRDFNIKHDHHNEECIGLLERQGIDLKKNREKGIDFSDFGRLILSSGLVSNNSSITWITFHGAYDVGFLIKILTKRELPSDMRSFLGMMRHQAGSDSLSSLQTFVRFKESCAKIDLEKLNGYEGMMFGLCEGWLGFTYAPDTFMGTLV